MKFLIGIILFLNINILFSQYTSIPDINFEYALIQDGLDSLPADGLVPTANIDTVKSLFYFNYGINDLTGIEDFRDLEALKIGRNGLTELDLSQNKKLKSLTCEYNNLECLNIKNGNNVNLFFYAEYNPMLSCIMVDDSVYATNNWSSSVDAGAYFSENCTNTCLVGISDDNLVLKRNFFMFPNPASNEINLVVDDKLYDVTIFDGLGRLVFEQLNISRKNMVINVSDFESGLYLIYVHVKGSMFNKKFLKE